MYKPLAAAVIAAVLASLLLSLTLVPLLAAPTAARRDRAACPKTSGSSAR